MDSKSGTVRYFNRCEWPIKIAAQQLAHAFVAETGTVFWVEHDSNSWTTIPH
jgi:hypothetical protein